MSKSSPFLSLYLREQNRLLHLIRRIVGDRSTAEDLAQDTYLRLWDRQLGDGDRSLLQRLRGLPKRCQQVFLLSRVDGVAFAAIAQQLGISLSTVEKDIFRVLQHCQRNED